MASKRIDVVKPDRKNGGFTLVEMVVAFALLGLFMVAAMRVISYTVSIYYAAKGTDNSLVVSNMVADKVAGLMSGMIEGTAVDAHTLDEHMDEGKMLPCIVEDGRSVLFNDSSNCPVKISVNDDNMLLVTYYRKQDDDEGGVTYQAVPWYFAEGTYMGYEIGDFEIKKDSDYPDNVYLLDFTIHSDRYGDYRTTRCIKCYAMPDAAP